ncbi:hypothetical protein NPIL_356231 [Nephila pilipes]|uniref:Uncharacterized protein n=1 Tax=Nephila pilipes TaxID=299642 RepID=A0A8X6QRL7_NEPPI|nr:hypothetical protein NPIL_356231 [Nephila pilipes]
MYCVSTFWSRNHPSYLNTKLPLGCLGRNPKATDAQQRRSLLSDASVTSICWSFELRHVVWGFRDQGLKARSMIIELLWARRPHRWAQLCS